MPPIHWSGRIADERFPDEGWVNGEALRLFD
jgi:hypothetical protein